MEDAERGGDRTELDPREHVTALLAELRQYPAPFTTWLVGVVCIAFAGQVALAMEVGRSVQVVTGALFLEYPETMWVLSPVLHRGIEHFAVNVVLLAFLGTLHERQFSPVQYLAFVAIAGAVSSVFAFATQAPFTEKHIAAYGASGIVLALAAYSVSYTPLRRPRTLDDLASVLFGATTPVQRLAVLLGISSVLLVLVDLASPPYLEPHWVNGAHLGGVLMGLAVGYLRPPTTDSA